MKTVREFINELSNFPVDSEVRFFAIFGREIEFVVKQFDQDEKGNPTILLGDKDE